MAKPLQAKEPRGAPRTLRGIQRTMDLQKTRGAVGEPVAAQAASVANLRCTVHSHHSWRFEGPPRTMRPVGVRASPTSHQPPTSDGMQPALHARTCLEQEGDGVFKLGAV